MLPRPDAPAKRLPYTTADMSERLAKKKAEQDAAAQAQANQALRFGVTNPPVQEDKGGGGGWLSQVGNMAKSLVLTPAGTALDMIPYVANIPGVKGEGAWGYEPEDIGTSNFFQAGGQALEQSTRHLVGDVTAIPGLGKDSPSYTADQIRKYGVAEGLASAGLDYGNLALTAAPFVKPTGMAVGNAINDAKYAAYLRRTKSPFPAVQRPANVIDVAEGSRLPARVVDSPATPITPATRLAEAQAARGLTATVDQPMTLPSKNITTIEKSGSGGGQQKLVLTNSDGRILATVTYDLRNEPMSAMPSRIEVDYLKSNFEGQGHGQELMQNLYDRYPNSFIDWGTTINPTSTHMAEKFADRYYDRTAYEPDIDQGVVGTEGMYSGEPDVVDSPATPATRLAEAQTQRALPPAATRALPPSAQRALPPATTADMAEQLARAQARQTTHFGTVSKEPISTMQSDEFAKIKTMTREDGGIPDPTSEIRQAYSLPVYEVGGKKVAFGTEGLGRFDPVFTDKNVEIIPFNPYVISGLSKATPEGQQMASTFFDAIHGFAMENNTQVALRNIGQVPALQLAASQGDNVALQELQRLAQVGQESINASRLKAQAKDLDWLKTSRSPYQQDLMVRTKDALGYEIQHPLNIDDLSFVHQTTYEPIIDANGNLIIKPSKDFAPIDPETGKPYIDKVTGKPLSANDQNSVHFSINHLAGGHIMRQSPVNGSYVIVAPAREILNANRGSLENLYAVDSFLTPKPGEGIVIPAGSFRIVKTPTLSDYGFKIPEGNPLLMPREIQNQIEKMYQQIINESSALARQTIDEVLKSYNNSDGYRPLQIPAGSHYSDGGIIDATIMKIAREQIAQEYPEYIGGVTSAIHAHQPTHSLMGISELDPTDFRRSSISGNNYWMLSPNAKLRIYDTKKFTTGNLDTTFEPDYGI